MPFVTVIRARFHFISPASMANDKRFYRGGSGQVANSVKTRVGLYARLKSTTVRLRSFGARHVRTKLSAGTLAFALVAGGCQGAGSEVPERIQSNDNRSPAGRLRDGALRIALELRTGRWNPEADDGRSEIVRAFAESEGPAQVPGPTIRVPEGTAIHATIRNTLEDSTLVVHGFHARPGAPDDTLLVPPQRTRVIRFRAGAPGTYFYWGATTNATLEQQVKEDSQLSGAFLVDPAAAVPQPTERIFVMGTWHDTIDSSGPGPRVPRDVMVINGKQWPHTERFTYEQGDTVRWRWLNPTADAHPMHLHGMFFAGRGSWAADTTYSGADARRSSQ
jgi:FtsP/CotA-like multicopper oxidase with cupredoxin domain